MLVEKHYSNRKEAAAAAAQMMADLCAEDLEERSEASLVVSGGTTPANCYEFLRQEELEWSRVTLMLSDERWLPVTHADSNEAMLRRTFHQGAAKHSTIVPIYTDGTTPESRCRELQTFDRLQPFSCVLLGMGKDGHFASLFPDAENLGEGLDVESEQLFIPVSTAASPHTRISMTLAALVRSRAILLLMFGEEKRRVLEYATEPVPGLPVSHLVSQDITPVTLIWAP